MLLRLGRAFAPYGIYQMALILMLLEQHAVSVSCCLFKMKYYHLRLNKAKYLVLSN